MSSLIALETNINLVAICIGGLALLILLALLGGLLAFGKGREHS